MKITSCLSEKYEEHKEIFSDISFSRLPFSFNNVVLKVFLKLSDLLKPAFEKSSKNNVNKSGKIIK